jgi:putative membrane protein
MIPVPYCGPSPHPGAIHTAWNLDPFVIAALLGAAWLLRRQPMSVQAGLALLGVAFVSPLCAMTAGLFSARSAHHLLIVFGAAPLLAPLLAPLRLGRVGLLPAFALSVAVFWLWHVPAAYAWALSSDSAYWLGQAALLGSAMLLWHALARSSHAAPVAFLVLIGTIMQMGLLGAILTFAPKAFYAPHFLTTQQYGLSPLEDQQLAGLLMWIGSLPLSVVAGWAVLARLFARMQREATA